MPGGKPVPPVAPPPAMLTAVTRKTMTDRVQLPRIYLAWLTPGLMRPGDAALDVAASLLTGGKNSRLYKRLVYDLQIAQDVVAYQQSQGLGSAFYLQATARPGKTVEELQKVIDEEIARLAASPPEPREMERVLNQIEASFLRQAERVGGFGGKANQLNAYYTNTGMPDFFAEDLARYRSIDADDISSVVGRLPAQGSPRRDDRPAGGIQMIGRLCHGDNSTRRRICAVAVLAVACASLPSAPRRPIAPSRRPWARRRR